MEHDIKKLVLEVLEGGFLMSLGTQDRGGVWVADVTYLHDEDLNIYWMSHPDTRHSQAILSDPQVAGTITVSNDPGVQNLGIQFSGQARKIDEERYDLALKHAEKKKAKKMPLDEKEYLKGRSWYVVKPTLIELIHEPHFGFKKQPLELGLQEGNGGVE